MFSTLSAQIGAVLTLGVCLFTVLSRRPPQVLAATLVAAAWIASAALQNRLSGDAQYAIFALDVGAAFAFIALALRYRAAWLILVAAFQLLTAATHVGMIVDTRIFVRAYLTAYLVWSYLLVLALAWGGREGWRQRRRPH